ncbi:hypothetical protein NDU88_001496 [Pleurodeles waltl]|uniref:EF-hand domain-containing protein n=1 Tax=Pleurodeles waltl TaxID=8319 RepID=A0AAV7U7C5_PLEWA|nr:hypothetical protein NDU88_001496 [Pleurodeles waltl]
MEERGLLSDVLYGFKHGLEIREAFRVLDRDGNGFISKQELGMAMRSLGYMPSEVELAIIMQRLDMDGKNQYTQSIVLIVMWSIVCVYNPLSST